MQIYKLETDLNCRYVKDPNHFYMALHQVYPRYHFFLTMEIFNIGYEIEYWCNWKYEGKAKLFRIK